MLKETCLSTHTNGESMIEEIEPIENLIQENGRTLSNDLRIKMETFSVGFWPTFCPPYRFPNRELFFNSEFQSLDALMKPLWQLGRHNKSRK